MQTAPLMSNDRLSPLGHSGRYTVSTTGSTGGRTGDRMQATDTNRGLVRALGWFSLGIGMASLLMDTVGASPFEPPLRIRYLPVEEAVALRDQLAAAMEARATPARTAA